MKAGAYRSKGMAALFRSYGLLCVFFGTLAMKVLSVYAGELVMEALSFFVLGLLTCFVVAIVGFDLISDGIRWVAERFGNGMPMVHVDVSRYIQLTRHNVVMLGLIQVGMLVTGMLAMVAIRISCDAFGIGMADIYWVGFWRVEAFLLPLLWAFCAGAVHQGPHWGETAEASLALLGILLTGGIGLVLAGTVSYAMFGWWGCPMM